MVEDGATEGSQTFSIEDHSRLGIPDRHGSLGGEGGGMPEAQDNGLSGGPEVHRGDRERGVSDPRGVHPVDEGREGGEERHRLAGAKLPAAFEERPDAALWCSLEDGEGAPRVLGHVEETAGIGSVRTGERLELDGDAQLRSRRVEELDDDGLARLIRVSCGNTEDDVGPAADRETPDETEPRELARER